MHLVDDVDAVELDHRTCGRPQRRVQHGTMFGHVDRLTCQHRIAVTFEAGHAGHADEGGEHGVVNGVLGVVDAQVADLDHVPLGTARIAVEQLAERARDRQSEERLPFRRRGDVADVIGAGVAVGHRP